MQSGTFNHKLNHHIWLILLTSCIIIITTMFVQLDRPTQGSRCSGVMDKNAEGVEERKLCKGKVNLTTSSWLLA